MMSGANVLCVFKGVALLASCNNMYPSFPAFGELMSLCNKCAQGKFCRFRKVSFSGKKFVFTFAELLFGACGTATRLSHNMFSVLSRGRKDPSR